MASVALQRRQFLKALGAGAAALPFYRLLESSAVQAQTPPPLRLLLLCSGYGGIWDNLRPRGLSGNDAPLTAASISYPGCALAPLAPFASRMTIIEGLALPAGLVATDAARPVESRTLYVGHDHTACSVWTGAAIRDSTDDSVPLTASLEHALGERLGAGTAVRSLQVGMGGYIAQDRGNALAFNATGQRQPGFRSAADAYSALFGTLTTSGPNPQQRQRSVLAAVQASARRLQGRLAGPERLKLDEHLTALSELEARLTAAPAVTCAAPQRPQGGGDLLAATRDHLALIREAFACDRTRFVTAGWNLQGDPIPGLLGPAVTDLHGQVAHLIEAPGAPGQLARTQMSQVQGWHAQKIADLMVALAAVREGSGSLLDNTLIAWAQDFGADVHGGLNVPYILLGGAQGRLRLGRFLQAAAPLSTNFTNAAWRSYVPVNRLLVSLMNAFGVAGTTFGSSEFEGALPGLQ